MSKHPYRSLPAVLAFLALAALAVLAFTPRAKADPGSSWPQAHYGSTTLAATTATAIPSAAMDARGGIFIQNLDANPIWCGTDTHVDNTTGIEVYPNGGHLSIELGYRYATSTQPVYCYSTAGTATNGVRWLEVK